MKCFLVAVQYAIILILISTQELQAQQGPFSPQFDVNLSYTSDIFGNLHGGISNEFRYLDNYDLEFELKTRRVTLLAYGLANQGRSISAVVGDIQSVSNIDTDNAWRIYEGWANIKIPEWKSSLLIGLYDLNSEFDVINTAGLFINSSHGIGAEFAFSGEYGPSIFPLTALSFRVKSTLSENLVIKAALLDATPTDPERWYRPVIDLNSEDGFLMVSEIEYTPGSASHSSLERGVQEEENTRFVIGGWKYTQHRTGWDGSEQQDYGAYVLAEAKVFNENVVSDQGMSAFIRVGVSNGKVNQLSNYIGSGISYQGLIPGRDFDVTGLAVSIPINSHEFNSAMYEQQQYRYDSESTLEFTHLMTVNERFTLQFDTQYVINPNQMPDLENAFLIGIRTSFNIF